MDSDPSCVYTACMIRNMCIVGFSACLLYSLFGCASVSPRPVEVSLPRRVEERKESFVWAEPSYRPKELKKLRVGMTKSEVLSLFQEPKSIKKTPSDEYWEYDWFELYFRGGRLVNWFDL